MAHVWKSRCESFGETVTFCPADLIGRRFCIYSTLQSQNDYPVEIFEPKNFYGVYEWRYVVARHGERRAHTRLISTFAVSTAVAVPANYSATAIRPYEDGRIRRRILINGNIPLWEDVAATNFSVAAYAISIEPMGRFISIGNYCRLITSACICPIILAVRGRITYATGRSSLMAGYMDAGVCSVRVGRRIITACNVSSSSCLLGGFRVRGRATRVRDVSNGITICALMSRWGTVRRMSNGSISGRSFRSRKAARSISANGITTILANSSCEAIAMAVSVSVSGGYGS